MDDSKLLACAKDIDAPFFVYDLDGLGKHLAGFDEFKKEKIRLWYACKANPLSSILQMFDEYGFGIDIASIGELDQSLNNGITPRNIISTGPGKSKKYLKELLEKGVKTIVLESTNQALWLNEIAAKMDLHVDVLLRGQLDWEREKSVLGGGEITPFGVEIEEWAQIDFKNLSHLNIKGFHVFQWGNILDLNRLEDIWMNIAAQVEVIAAQLKVEDYVLDLGGGIGIPYTSTLKPVEKKDVLNSLKKIINKTNACEIWLELGRYAVGEYGFYCSTVVDKKIVKGKRMLILEGGINHLLRPGLTQESFPVHAIGKESKDLVSFSIHGPLCTALDYHGEYQLPKNIDVGDWLAFSKVGAYGFTESMPFFLCHHLPAEVIYHDASFTVKRPVKPASSWLV